MSVSNYKYLLAYIIPVSGFFAVYYGGYLSFLTVFIAFVMIPLIEFFVARSRVNLDQKSELDLNKVKYFDYLLYLNVPLIYLLVIYLFVTVTSLELATYELVGIILSVGIIFGASGINVAHELGHKKGTFEQTLAKLLLLPNLYMHFFIEHNRGHHVHVSTPEDPATSRKGEMVYVFWIRSTVGSYISAWKLEAQRLSKLGKSWLSPNNAMIQFQIYQLIYLAGVYFLFDTLGLLIAIAVAIIGFLLLETINYIEHYGLLRKKLPSGRYERVEASHSWNSNHEIGRIILYELTRHSDHHYKAYRKYQVLRHHDESPQLPLGYPGSMLMSFVPPLWFAVMNKKLAELSAYN